MDIGYPVSIHIHQFMAGGKIKAGVFQFLTSTLLALPPYASNPSSWNDGQPLQGGEIIYRTDTGNINYYDKSTTVWKTLGTGTGSGTTSSSRLLMMMGA